MILRLKQQTRLAGSKQSATPCGTYHRATQRIVRLLALASMVLGLGAGPALAQVSSSYVTPFPSGETYRLHVFGDSLANGLFRGLQEELASEASVLIVDKARSGTGLARTNKVNWPKAIADAAVSAEINIAVLMFGASDRQSIRAGGKRHKVGSPEWQRVYASRVDAILDTLREEKSAIYWVGLPIMKGAKRNADMQQMNAIFRERALRRGLRFIDTWDGFADQDGNYTDWGPDLEGRVQRLRAKDGVHFTVRGFRKLAHSLARVIKRDLALARSQRAVPLAGGDNELAEIKTRLEREAREDQRLAAREDAGSALSSIGSVLAGGDAIDGRAADVPQLAYPADDSAVTLKVRGADGQVVNQEIKLVRPSIPAAVVSHIRRRSPAAVRRTSGEALPISLGDGLTVIGRMTPTSTWVTDGDTRGVVSSPTQTPYYKVLVKGESVPPKPGRADDFAWPRPGMPVDPAG